MSKFLNPYKEKNSNIGNKIATNTVKNDVDDFWNDCLAYESSNQHKSNKSNHKAVSEDYITFDDNPNKSNKNLNKSSTTARDSLDNPENIIVGSDHSKQKYLNLIQEFDSDSQVTPEQLLIRQREEEKKKKSLERCIILYEKGKIKNEVNKIMYIKNEEFKIQNELKDCTWKPQVHKISKKMEQNLKIVADNLPVYNRNLKWKDKATERIKRCKSIIQKGNPDHTYKPVINENPNLGQVFNEQNTIYKDFNTRSFVFRLEKARVEQEDKKKRAVKDLTDKTKDKWAKSMIKSRSMKDIDTQIHKQTLREELHNFKYDDTE